MPRRNRLPTRLAEGIRLLSGVDVSDVRVHHDSSAPDLVDAEAFTQGRDIHIAPGQRHHLAHEAWHVAQQRMGRVRATSSINGVGVNEESHLETEADEMGRRAELVDPPSASSSP